ncbi:MAG TPA: RecQ family zinc-binding domain-containing protein, partial [Ginsengibacter sp.]|nr:RecQ family zinc-binding domain-containing protein [Ginsengibacter sp.]
YPSPVNETRLAKFISLKKEKVITDLIEIKKMGIIDYTPQKENPQIKFLQNRVNTSDLIINQKNISKRKDSFEKRLQAILKYVREQHSCRSKMIAAYFNDLDVKRCGICDNCLHEKTLAISREEFEKIKKEIRNLVTKVPSNAKELVVKMPAFNQSKILKVLHFLQQENIVSITEDGLIIIKSN